MFSCLSLMETAQLDISSRDMYIQRFKSCLGSMPLVEETFKSSERFSRRVEVFYGISLRQADNNLKVYGHGEGKVDSGKSPNELIDFLDGLPDNILRSFPISDAFLKFNRRLLRYSDVRRDFERIERYENTSMSRISLGALSVVSGPLLFSLPYLAEDMVVNGIVENPLAWGIPGGLVALSGVALITNAITRKGKLPRGWGEEKREFHRLHYTASLMDKVVEEDIRGEAFKTYVEVARG